MPEPDPQEITPFHIAIPQEALTDLHERLERTRWAQELPNAGWDYGVPVGYVQELAHYWRTGYDWRKWEARLNEYPQFITVIDGQRVHFLHVRSPEPDAVPLILTHGWPGSVANFLDIIDPLVDPRAHGATDAPAFHLVIPSLPGYAFSGPTNEPGWDSQRVARAWADLMRRLGYDRYLVGGNDTGARVSVDLARAFPDQVIGVHVTQIWSEPCGDPGELEGLSEADQNALDIRNWFRDNLGAYEELHSQQPQNLAHALADSPAGLLGWYVQIYRDDNDADFILTDVTLTWLTNTVASNLRMYYEIRRGDRPTEPTRVPLGLAQFNPDFISIRRFSERDHHNIVSWNGYDSPGHYAAHESPDLLIDDIRGFFTQLG